MAIEPPACPYCDAPSELVTGDVLYPHRRDLHGSCFYRCVPCEAWVGCHRGTLVPLGRLANAELRAAKSAAHREFDPLWRAKIQREGCSKSTARGLAYAWLAGQLGIDVKECHIGQMDVEMCARVVAICRPYRARLR